MLSTIVKYAPCAYMYNGEPNINIQLTKRILYKGRIVRVDSLAYAAVTNNYHLWKAHKPHWSHYVQILHHCITYHSVTLMSLVLEELTIDMCDDAGLMDLIDSAVLHHLPSSILNSLRNLLSTHCVNYNDSVLRDGYCHLIGVVRKELLYLKQCIEHKLYEEVDYLLPHYSESMKVSLIEKLQFNIDERMLDILLAHCGDNQLLYYYQIRLGRDVQLPKYDEMELCLWLLRPQECEIICSRSQYNITLDVLLTLDYVPPCLVNFPQLLKHIAACNPNYYLKILEHLDLNDIQEVRIDIDLNDKLQKKLGIFDIIE